MTIVRQVLTASAMVAGGLAIGAGLGLLFAPQSGRVTRGQIQVQAHKVQDHMMDWGERIRKGVDSVVDKGKHLVRRYQ